MSFQFGQLECSTMSEMRFNPITLDWVIMAPERDMRPDDFRCWPETRPVRSAHRKDCPFCLGNEHLTPPEITRVDAPDGSWNVRVFSNKYPAFVTADDLKRRKQGLFRSMVAAGAHEVLVEHPRHDRDMGDMEPSHLALLLRTYRERYTVLRSNPLVESIVIFKNHGKSAGSSLEHSHSQIIAAPVISSQVWNRLQEARRYHELNGGCLYCTVVKEEHDDGERIVESSPSFAAFMPYASLSPFHTWVFPLKHQPSFDQLSDTDIDELAVLLGRLLRRLKVAAGDPDFNISIRSAPVGEMSSNCFHWYLSLVPRLIQLAGFELGSGTYINSMRPEICAERFRSVEL
ncbi:MAG: galactose-1-phosphate uridylyltransferase [Prosthecobacter sp.]